MKNTSRKLAELWDRAMIVYQSSANSHDYETAFEDVLNFILSQKESSNEMETEMIEFYGDPNRCLPDLLEFCMATLRWSRLKSVISQDLGEHVDMRRRTCASNILSAYRDDWDGSGVYRFYTPSQFKMPQ